MEDRYRHDVVGRRAQPRQLQRQGARRPRPRASRSAARSRSAMTRPASRSTRRRQLDFPPLPQIVVDRRRARRSDDDRGQGSRIPDPAAGAKGARGGHPPDHGDAAPVGRRHHRRDQGEFADADQLQRHVEDRFAHHPGRAGRRAAARQGRHALHGRAASRSAASTGRSSATTKSARSPITGARRAQPDYIQSVTEEPTTTASRSTARRSARIRPRTSNIAARSSSSSKARRRRPSGCSARCGSATTRPRG